MARIINAKTMLQLYATVHPELELSIHLTDEQVSANNGYYYLNNGKCMNSAKRLPGSHLALTSVNSPKNICNIKPIYELDVELALQSAEVDSLKYQRRNLP